MSLTTLVRALLTKQRVVLQYERGRGVGLVSSKIISAPASYLPNDLQVPEELR
jgi:hypothetical protein